MDNDNKIVIMSDHIKDKGARSKGEKRFFNTYYIVLVMLLILFLSTIGKVEKWITAILIFAMVSCFWIIAGIMYAIKQYEIRKHKNNNIVKFRKVS